MKIARPGTPWGNGTIWDWFPLGAKPEEGTIRGGLIRAIDAQHMDNPKAESSAWTSICSNGEPFWKEATRWSLCRWAYSSAMASGFVHSRAEVINHVSVIMSPSHNGTLRHKADPDTLFYEFNDGSWVAFQRASPVEDEVDGVSIVLHPDLYTQLSEKPPRFIDEPVPTVLATPKAEAATPPEDPTPKVDTVHTEGLGAVFQDFPWEISFKDQENEKTKNRDKASLPDPFEFSIPPFEFSIPEDDPPEHKPLRPEPAAPEHKPDTEPTADRMVQISCSNSGCKSNVITSIHNWPPALYECNLCNEGTTIAHPCGFRTKFNAWHLQQRPRFPAKWTCNGCGHDDILHGGGTPSSLSCSACDCTSFEVASLDCGSECTDCGYKVPWNCTLPGVENICDKCAKPGTLVLFGKAKPPLHAPVTRVKKKRGRPRVSKTFNQADKRKAVKKQRSDCIECGEPILAGAEFRELKKRKVHERCLGRNLTK